MQLGIAVDDRSVRDGGRAEIVEQPDACRRQPGRPRRPGHRSEVVGLCGLLRRTRPRNAPVSAERRRRRVAGLADAERRRRGDGLRPGEHVVGELAAAAEVVDVEHVRTHRPEPSLQPLQLTNGIRPGHRRVTGVAGPVTERTNGIIARAQAIVCGFRTSSFFSSTEAMRRSPAYGRQQLARPRLRAAEVGPLVPPVEQRQLDPQPSPRREGYELSQPRGVRRTGMRIPEQVGRDDRPHRIRAQRREPLEIGGDPIGPPVAPELRPAGVDAEVAHDLQRFRSCRTTDGGAGRAGESARQAEERRRDDGQHERPHPGHGAPIYRCLRVLGPIRSQLRRSSSRRSPRTPVASANRRAHEGHVAGHARGERRRPRSQVDRAAGARRHSRKRLEVALPEAERLTPRARGQHEREATARVGPARRDGSDRAVRARHADEQTAVDRPRRRRRLGERHRRARSGQPHVHLGAAQALEGHVPYAGRERDPAEGDLDAERQGVGAHLVRGGEEGDVAPARVRGLGERPEVAVDRAGDDGRALCRPARPRPGSSPRAGR